MKIHEHKPYAVIKVVPRIGDAFCFESRILPSIESKPEGYILIEPMKNGEGKYLNFDGMPCVLEITADDSNCVYRYKISKMGYIKWKSKVYFVVYSNDDVDIYNRRLQYRLPFVAKGQLQVGRHTRVYSCYIHDISINGISITVMEGKDFNCNTGDSVSVSFEQGEEQEIYKVSGTVVRADKKEPDSSLMRVGIYIDEPTRMWTGFVSRLQREELQRLRVERDREREGCRSLSREDLV